MGTDWAQEHQGLASFISMISFHLLCHLWVKFHLQTKLKFTDTKLGKGPIAGNTGWRDEHNLSWLLTTANPSRKPRNIFPPKSLLSLARSQEKQKYGLTIQFFKRISFKNQKGPSRLEVKNKKVSDEKQKSLSLVIEFYCNPLIQSRQINACISFQTTVSPLFHSSTLH